MIQFGVMANTHPAPGTDLTQMVDEVIAEAQQAERCGFDSFFLTEHHQEASGYLPSPLPLAAAIAARKACAEAASPNLGGRAGGRAHEAGGPPG